MGSKMQDRTLGHDGFVELCQRQYILCYVYYQENGNGVILNYTALHDTVYEEGFVLMTWLTEETTN